MKQGVGMAFVGVAEVEHISEAPKCAGSLQPQVDTLQLDGAPRGLAGRHRCNHGCFSYHNPMVAAVTVAPLDSGIWLVIIHNVPAVVSLLLFIFFMSVLMGSWGRVVRLNLKMGNFKTIPWRWELCWKSRVSHISQQQSKTGGTAPGLWDRKSSRRQEKSDGA